MNLRHTARLLLFTALLAIHRLHAQTAATDSTTAPATQGQTRPAATAGVSAGSTAADTATRLAPVDVTGTAAKIAEDATAGTKTDTPLVETPQAISVVTADELDLRDPQTIAQALRYTAGVSSEYYGDDPRGYDWVKIRGFDTFNSQYLDGLRLFNYETAEVFGLDRIEVLNGPSSVLYGQSTPGGLIDGISRRPTAAAFGEISAEIGTGEAYETTLDLGGPIGPGDAVLYRLTGLFHDNEHDSNGYDVRARRAYLAPALTWRIGRDTTLTLLTSYTHSESTQTPSLAASPSGAPTSVFLNNKNLDSEVNDIIRLGYQLEHHVSDDLVFRQNFRVSRYNVEDLYLNIDTSTYADGYSTPTTLERTANLWKSANRSLAIDNQAALKLEGDHLEQTLLAGFDWSFSSADTLYYEDSAPSLDITHPDYNAAVAEPSTLVSDTYQRNTQAGVYAQDQIKLCSRWIALVSGRYDWASSDTKDRLGGSHDEQRDQAFSGRVGLSYLADCGLAPYASYSTSFYPNSGTDISGHTFDPTEGRQYEIGLKYAPKDSRGDSTLSLYDLTESHVLTDDLSNPGYQVETGRIRARGIELENKFALTRSLDLITGAYYNDIEITKDNSGNVGNVPALTPRVGASTWLDYTFRDGSLRGLTLGGGVRYVGPDYGDDANTIRNQGYAAVDLGARYIRGRWRYSLHADNLLDTVRLIGDGSGYYRTAGFSLRGGVAYAW